MESEIVIEIRVALLTFCAKNNLVGTNIFEAEIVTLNQLVTPIMKGLASQMFYPDQKT